MKETKASPVSFEDDILKQAKFSTKLQVTLIYKNRSLQLKAPKRLGRLLTMQFVRLLIKRHIVLVFSFNGGLANVMSRMEKLGDFCQMPASHGSRYVHLNTYLDS